MIFKNNYLLFSPLGHSKEVNMLIAFLSFIVYYKVQTYLYYLRKFISWISACVILALYYFYDKKKPELDLDFDFGKQAGFLLYFM